VTALRAPGDWFLITRRMADKVGKKDGKVAFIPFQPGTLTDDTRTEGFREVLGKNPQLDLVATQSSESGYNTALLVTNGILTAHPDLNAIYAANEPGVLGTAESCGAMALGYSLRSSASTSVLRFLCCFS
jgi:ABC-type sugar transport system substrate-binding protein